MHIYIHMTIVQKKDPLASFREGFIWPSAGS